MPYRHESRRACSAVEDGAVEPVPSGCPTPVRRKGAGQLTISIVNPPTRLLPGWAASGCSRQARCAPPLHGVLGVARVWLWVL